MLLPDILSRNHTLSPHNATTPLRAINLHSTAHAQTDPGVPKQRRVRFRIDAEIEVEVRSVLVRSRQTALRAQRVALRRAQVRDHDDDAVPCIAERVARAVLLDRELPACAAAGTGAGALALSVSALNVSGCGWEILLDLRRRRSERWRRCNPGCRSHMRSS